MVGLGLRSNKPFMKAFLEGFSLAGGATGL